MIRRMAMLQEQRVFFLLASASVSLWGIGEPHGCLCRTPQASKIVFFKAIENTFQLSIETRKLFSICIVVQKAWEPSKGICGAPRIPQRLELAETLRPCSSVILEIALCNSLFPSYTYSGPSSLVEVWDSLMYRIAALMGNHGQWASP